jgi:carboxylate-amine ligase
VSAFPLAGHIPYVLDWAQFSDYFHRMRDFGVVRSMKDFYWDIRPKPEYGTVEIRVCDTPLTVHRAVLLAAYAQALGAHYLGDRSRAPAREIYLVNSHNRFEACRFGYAGEMIDPYGGPKKKMRDDILDTLEIVSAHAPALESSGLLEELAGLARAEDSDADWLRSQAKQRGSLADAVRAACARWSESG